MWDKQWCRLSLFHKVLSFCDIWNSDCGIGEVASQTVAVLSKSLEIFAH
jgi:hypothetical protein